MSINTPRALVVGDPAGEVVLQRHRQAIVHVDLDRHDQILAHPKDRYVFHVTALLTSANLDASDSAPGLVEGQAQGRRPEMPWC